MKIVPTYPQARLVLLSAMAAVLWAPSAEARKATIDVGGACPASHKGPGLFDAYTTDGYQAFFKAESWTDDHSGEDRPNWARGPNVTPNRVCKSTVTARFEGATAVELLCHRVRGRDLSTRKGAAAVRERFIIAPDGLRRSMKRLKTPKAVQKGLRRPLFLAACLKAWKREKTRSDDEEGSTTVIKSVTREKIRLTSGKTVTAWCRDWVEIPDMGYGQSKGKCYAAGYGVVLRRSSGPSSPIDRRSTLVPDPSIKSTPKTD